ncbi:ATP-binding protein, partial [Bacteroides faecis]
LYPFSFPEFLKIKEVYPQQKDFYTTTGKSILKRYFDEYVKTGGFPRYIKDPNTNYLSTLYENIIYKDVVTRNKLNGERELLEMVYYLASNATKRFSYTSLAKTIGIKHTETVKNYLEYLENTYLLFQVMKFDWSVKKQMNNQKKVYFIDNAIIGKVGFNATDNIGQLLENLVFIEIKRQRKDVYYHDDGIECDFIMRENGHIVSACQVTRSMKDEKTRQREINGLVSALNAYNLTEGMVLTDDETEEITIDNKKIHIIPIWRWLLKDSVTIPLT